MFLLTRDTGVVQKGIQRILDEIVRLEKNLDGETQRARNYMQALQQKRWTGEGTSGGRVPKLEDESIYISMALARANTKR